MKHCLSLLMMWGVSLAYAAGSGAGNSPQPIEQKAAPCAVCHGPQGISLNPLWPNLAGQHPAYLVKQLHDIKQNKTRHVPVMLSAVACLNEQDFTELADYYAKLPIAQGIAPQKYLKRGEQLYRGGDFKKGITACIACHGPGGTGNAQAGFPAVSGQHALYLIQQMKDFKAKQRKNDLNGIMQTISSHMDEEDMAAVAYYMQGLY